MKTSLIVLVLLSSIAAQFEIRCKQLNTYDFKGPEDISVEIINKADSAIYIWKPSGTFWWLWTIEIFKNGKPRFYVPRQDVAWGEPDAILLAANSFFRDTIHMPVADYYDIKCMNKDGCYPFVDADSMRLIYNFKGKLLPSENMTGVFIPENKPIQKMTIKGEYKSNWITIKSTKNDIDLFLKRKKTSTGIDSIVDDLRGGQLKYPCCDR